MCQARSPNGGLFSRSFASTGPPVDHRSGNVNVRQLLSSASANNRELSDSANAEMVARMNPASYTRDWELQEWGHRWEGSEMCVFRCEAQLALCCTVRRNRVPDLCIFQHCGVLPAALPHYDVSSVPQPASLLVVES